MLIEVHLAVKRNRRRNFEGEKEEERLRSFNFLCNLSLNSQRATAPQKEEKKEKNKERKERKDASGMHFDKAIYNCLQ